MNEATIDLPRLALAGFAGGVWVVMSGMLMAAVFGYREMKNAFDAIGLAVPQGPGPMMTHTLVRLVLGAIIVTLFGMMARALPRPQAILAAAGFAWLLASVLPYAVMAEWGLFSWSLGAKVWAWSAVEFLIAAAIGAAVYRV